VRPREFWYWLGAAFLTGGGVMTALAIGYYTVNPHSSLGASSQMAGAYAAFGCAFGCFLAAITGWRPWYRFLRFPNLVVRVQSSGFTMAVTERLPSDFPPYKVRLEVARVHITNAEADRRASIRDAYLVAKTKPESGLLFGVFSAPCHPFKPADSMKLTPLEFSIELDAQATKTGDLVFELSEFDWDSLMQPLQARVELHDAITGKMATFPWNTISTFSRGHGLRSTILAERLEWVEGPTAPQAWHGVLGPPDP